MLNYSKLALVSLIFLTIISLTTAQPRSDYSREFTLEIDEKKNFGVDRDNSNWIKLTRIDKENEIINFRANGKYKALKTGNRKIISFETGIFKVKLLSISEDGSEATVRISKDIPRVLYYSEDGELMDKDYINDYSKIRIDMRGTNKVGDILIDTEFSMPTDVEILTSSGSISTTIKSLKGRPLLEATSMEVGDNDRDILMRPGNYKRLKGDYFIKKSYSYFYTVAKKPDYIFRERILKRPIKKEMERYGRNKVSFSDQIDMQDSSKEIKVFMDGRIRNYAYDNRYIPESYRVETGALGHGNKIVGLSSGDKCDEMFNKGESGKLAFIVIKDSCVTDKKQRNSGLVAKEHTDPRILVLPKSKLDNIDLGALRDYSGGETSIKMLEGRRDGDFKLWYLGSKKFYYETSDDFGYKKINGEAKIKGKTIKTSYSGNQDIVYTKILSQNEVNPKANFSAPSILGKGEAGTFDASYSQPPKGKSISSYSWSFGKNGETVEKSFSEKGMKEVRLTVTASNGVKDSKTRNIWIGKGIKRSGTYDNADLNHWDGDKSTTTFDLFTHTVDTNHRSKLTYEADISKTIKGVRYFYNTDNGIDSIRLGVKFKDGSTKWFSDFQYGGSGQESKWNFIDLDEIKKDVTAWKIEVYNGDDRRSTQFYLREIQPQLKNYNSGGDDGSSGGKKINIGGLTEVKEGEKYKIGPELKQDLKIEGIHHGETQGENYLTLRINNGDTFGPVLKTYQDYKVEGTTYWFYACSISDTKTSTIAVLKGERKSVAEACSSSDNGDGSDGGDSYSVMKAKHISDFIGGEVDSVGEKTEIRFGNDLQNSLYVKSIKEEGNRDRILIGSIGSKNGEEILLNSSNSTKNIEGLRKEFNSGKYSLHICPEGASNDGKISFAITKVKGSGAYSACFIEEKEEDTSEYNRVDYTLGEKVKVSKGDKIVFGPKEKSILYVKDLRKARRLDEIYLNGYANTIMGYKHVPLYEGMSTGANYFYSGKFYSYFCSYNKKTEEAKVVISKKDRDAYNFCKDRVKQPDGKISFGSLEYPKKSEVELNYDITEPGQYYVNLQINKDPTKSFTIPEGNNSGTINYKATNEGNLTAKLVAPGTWWNPLDNRKIVGSASTYIYGSNERPVADLRVDKKSVAPGEKFQLDASESYDPDGEIVNYTIMIKRDPIARGVKTSEKILSPGIYEYQVQVKDNKGKVDQDSAIVNVTKEKKQNKPPEAVFSYKPDKPLTKDTLKFDASRSTDDRGIKSYSWDLDGDGIYEKEGSKVSKNYKKAGEKEITLKVTDKKGKTSQKSTSIYVEDTTKAINAIKSCSFEKDGYHAAGTDVEGPRVTANIKDSKMLPDAVTVVWKSGEKILTSRGGVSPGSALPAEKPNLDQLRSGTHTLKTLIKSDGQLLDERDCGNFSIDREAETKLSVSKNSIEKGQSLTIKYQVTPNVAKNGYKLTITNPSGEQLFNEEFGRRSGTKKFSTDEDSETGVYTVKLEPEQGFLQDLLTSILGLQHQEQFEVKKKGQELEIWRKHCKQKGYNPNTPSGRANCIEKQIAPKCFQKNPGNKCTKIANSVCNYYLGNSFNPNTGKCGK